MVTIIFGISVLAFIVCDNDTYYVSAIISGVTLGMIIIIIACLHSHKCEHKSNVIDRYEQLTGEKPACKKPAINENHIAKNNEITFNVVKVNNEDVAKLTFYDTMSVKRFFDPKHKCSVKECVSNYRKYVQNYLNQYAIKRLDIAWPSGTYTILSTNTIKLSEIYMH